ncbi:MAG: pilus assembly protein [Anaerolineae bacterium]|nr:pilus assembly protein [Anaerolineae bacterium]
MNSYSHCGKEDNRAQASVEALLVLMLLALLVFGGVELSRGVAVRQALDSGCGAAVRALSLDPGQWSFAGNLIQQSVQQNVMGAGPVVSVQVYDSANTPRSSAWLSGSPFGTVFILEASAPFQADIPFLPNSPMSIRVRHWGIVERYP